jgi:hypothetical protein
MVYVFMPYLMYLCIYKYSYVVIYVIASIYVIRYKCLMGCYVAVH